MSDLSQQHSVSLVDGERGGRWEDSRHNHDQEQQHLQTEAAHQSSSMNPFLVEMTNCEEDYFNTQEVPP